MGEGSAADRNAPVDGHRTAMGWQPRLLLPFGVALIAFLIDLETPRGVVDGYLYVLAVLACAWVPGVNVALYTAIALTIPMGVGFVLSPGDVPVSIAIANRLAGLLVTWLAAAVVWHNARLVLERDRALEGREAAQAASESAADSERAELSRWLQMAVVRELATLRWRPEGMFRSDPPDIDAGRQVGELRDVIDRVQQAVAVKASQVMDAASKSASCRAVIERQIETLRAQTGLALAVRGMELLPELQAERMNLCQTFLQESLSNVFKHACAERVRIEIQEDGNALQVTVIDDGCGLNAAAQNKLGRGALADLDRQLAVIGGQLTLLPGVPHGLRVRARIPLR